MPRQAKGPSDGVDLRAIGQADAAGAREEPAARAGPLVAAAAEAAAAQGCATERAAMTNYGAKELRAIAALLDAAKGLLDCNLDLEGECCVPIVEFDLGDVATDKPIGVIERDSATDEVCFRPIDAAPPERTSSQHGPPPSARPSAALGPIHPHALYPLAELAVRSGLGKAALRTARQSGLVVRYVGGRAKVLGSEFHAYVEKAPTSKGERRR